MSGSAFGNVVRELSASGFNSCLLLNTITFFGAVSDLQAEQVFVFSLDFLLPVSQDEDLRASENLQNTGEK